MALTRAEYDIQYARLEKAVADLTAGGSRLQAIARAYYKIYVTASYLASKFGVVVVHNRGGRQDEKDEFTHTATVMLVQTLYDGMPHGNVQPDKAPGIGAPRLQVGEAARYVQQLQRDRVDADYGPTRVAEPYTKDQADERLKWAGDVVEALRSLL